MANKRTAKKSAKKEVAKAAVTPVVAEEAKAETTAAAPAVEEVKAAPVEKAPRARKNAEKKAPAKAAEKKPADDKFIIQGSNGEYTMSDVVEACKTAYRNGTRKHITSCDVYLKAENGVLRAYYVINGKAEGAFIDL